MSFSTPRTFWTRIFALATVLLVAMPLSALAPSSYLCRMTGQVSEHCCCKQNEQQKPCGAKIETQDCCQLVKAQSQTTAPVTREPVHQAAASLPVYEIVLALLAPPASSESS